MQYHSYTNKTFADGADRCLHRSRICRTQPLTPTSQHSHELKVLSPCYICGCASNSLIHFVLFGSVCLLLAPCPNTSRCWDGVIPPSHPHSPPRCRSAPRTCLSPMPPCPTTLLSTPPSPHPPPPPTTSTRRPWSHCPSHTNPATPPARPHTPPPTTAPQPRQLSPQPRRPLSQQLLHPALRPLALPPVLPAVSVLHRLLACRAVRSGGV